MAKPKDQRLSPDNPGATPETSLGGCLVRLCWMMLGNVALLLTAAWISQQHSGFLSVADAAFWGLIAFVIAARYVDVARFQGRTATYEPATMVHWRRYALGVLLFGLGVWILAHGLACLTG
jgi:hypothetical protein